MGVRFRASAVGVGEDVGGMVGEVLGGDALVLVDFVVGDVGPCEVIGEDSPNPQAWWVEDGVLGDDFPKELGGGDEPVLVGNVGVVWARPVAVPGGLSGVVAAGATLGRGVGGVEASVGPSRAVVYPLGGAALRPHVEGAKFVLGVVGGLEVGGAFLQTFAPRSGRRRCTTRGVWWL